VIPTGKYRGNTLFSNSWVLYFAVKPHLTMANKFDRIIKENFREPTMWLLKKVGGAKSVESVPLLPKMQHTLEKEADMLLLLKCSGEEGDFIANIEWQATNDPKMAERMLLYYALAFRTYRLPVKSYVVYIGRDKLQMSSEVHHPMLQFSYEIIDLSELSPQEFLSSDVPEEVILAGRRKKEAYRVIIQEILYKLRKLLVHDEVELSCKIQQLEVLGELRNIQQLITEEEQTMRFADAILEAYNIENDIRYNQGREKATHESKTAVVKNLLLKTNHTIQDIADFAEVSVDFVLEIKKTLPSA
jgi:hypothetical protein